VADNGHLFEILSVEQSSQFANIGAITATATASDGSTSTFSQCSPVEEFRDGDVDGVFDIEEAFGPNRGDGNLDGVPDAQQPNVASLNTDGGYLTLVAPPGATMQNVRKFATDGFQFPSGASMPYGIFGFDVQGLPPGAMAVVDVLVPTTPNPNEVYVKQLPSPDGVTGHLYRIGGISDTGEGVEHTATGWRLHFRDGGTWDIDHTANGRLRDPGGPALEGAVPFPTAPAAPAAGLSITVTVAHAQSAVGRRDGNLVLAGRFKTNGGTVRCGENVVVSFGSWSTTLPGSGFRTILNQCVWAGRNPTGFIAAMTMDLRLGTWAFAAAGPGVVFATSSGPVAVSLAIGEDGGSTTVTLRK
jgi:hypothetical protein